MYSSFKKTKTIFADQVDKNLLLMKRFVLLMACVSVITLSQAQYSKRNSSKPASDGSSFMDKMYFSGGGGFGTGTGPYGRYTYYSLLPTVGYRVSQEFLVGMNIMYSKYSFPDVGISYDQLGYAPFARYYFQQFFVQAEYDRISSATYYDKNRYYFDRFLLGAGFAQPMGKRSALNVMALYDVLYKPNGVFNSPWVFRVFVSF
jgi:hypothetical protein